MPLALIALTLVLCAARPVAAAEPAVVRVEGRFFTISTRGLPERLAREAQETADAAWPFIREVFDVPRRGYPDRPVIHLHQSQEDYEKAEYALTRGRFKAHLAFSSWETWESHIALQPFLAPEAHAGFGLPALTRQQIAHEATHIASYRAWNCYQQLPLWFSEGAACYVARRTLLALGLAAEDASDPESSMDVLRVRRMIEAGEAPRLADYLDGKDPGGERLPRYALWGLVFEFLMTPGNDALFKRTFPAIGALKGEAGDERRIADIVRDTLNERRISALDDAFRLYLETRNALWDMPYRSLDVRADGWYQGTLQKNAEAWRTQALPAHYRIRGKVTILPGSATQMNVLLARRTLGFLQVSFHPSSVTVQEFRADAPNGASWQRLAQAPCASIAPLHELAYEIVVSAGHLRVRVDDADVLELDLGTRDLAGAMGLGALRGSAGVWRALEVEPLP